MIPNTIKTLKTLFTAAASVALFATTGLSQDAGTWTVNIGAHNLSPRSSNSDVAGGLRTKVEDDTQPTLAVEYFVYKNVGIELLASTPFRHDIKIDGLGYVGQTKLLPPTLSLQYHFENASQFSPFVGAGVNYTKFFDMRGAGALADVDLKAKQSWGFAAHAGVDYKLTARSSIRLDARWVEVKSKIKADAAHAGTLRLDPIVFGAGWVYRF